MAILKKLTMYVCDLEGNLSTDILHQMIDTYVLGRISTNGFCLLKEEKSKEVEWRDDYPLNYYDKSDDPNEWDKCLDNEHPNLSQESANCDKFTLTAEEVENLKPLVENIVSRITEGGNIITLIPNDDLKPFMDNLLTRIKQWQDENRTHN